MSSAAAVVPTAAEGATRIILVHGTGHGGWCWYRVTALLRAAGHRLAALDLAASGIDARQLADVPTFEDYTGPLLDELRALPPGQRAVLVGHSFGGLSIALAAEAFPEKVAAAVFVAALLPDFAGGSPRSRTIEELPLAESVDTARDDAHVPPSVTLGPEFLRRKLYLLSPPEDHALALSSQPPFSADRYGAVSKVYVVCKHDQAVLEAYQRKMIAECPVAEVREIASADHMAMFSAPVELAGHLADIANTYA